MNKSTISTTILNSKLLYQRVKLWSIPNKVDSVNSEGENEWIWYRTNSNQSFPKYIYHILICIHIYIYIYIHICIHIAIYIYIHMYTHSYVPYFQAKQVCPAAVLWDASAHLMSCEINHDWVGYWCDLLVICYIPRLKSITQLWIYVYV